MSPSTNPSLDNELSAVNTILNAIGQSPVSSFDSNNPELSLIHNILIEVSKDVQNEGWVFNTEINIKKTPNTGAPLKYVPVGNNVLRYDISDGQVYRIQE